MTMTSARPGIGISLSVATALALVAPVAATAASEPRGVEVFTMLAGDPGKVCGNRAYVTNSYSDTLSVIDVDKAKVVATLPTGKAPVNATFSPDWSRLVYANGKGGTLGLVDTRTARAIATIPAGGAKPSGLRFLHGGHQLVVSYLADELTGPSQLGLLDLDNGKLAWKIPVGVRSERFDVTPDGSRAYVGNLLGQSVTVVDLTRGQVIATIPTPEPYPFNVLISPKGDRAYVGAVMGGAVFEIDTATNQVVRTIRTPAGPNGMAFTPDGDNLFITTTYAGRLHAYNRSSGVLSDGAFVGFMPGFVRLTRDGTKGIVVRPYGRSVSIIDGTTMQITAQVPTGVGPSTVAICGNP